MSLGGSRETMLTRCAETQAVAPASRTVTDLCRDSSSRSCEPHGHRSAQRLKQMRLRATQSRKKNQWRPPERTTQAPLRRFDSAWTDSSPYTKTVKNRKSCYEMLTAALTNCARKWENGGVFILAESRRRSEGRVSRLSLFARPRTALSQSAHDPVPPKLVPVRFRGLIGWRRSTLELRPICRCAPRRLADGSSSARPHSVA